VFLQYFDAVARVFWPVIIVVRTIAYTVLAETLNHAQSKLNQALSLVPSMMFGWWLDQRPVRWRRDRFTLLICDRRATPPIDYRTRHASRRDWTRGWDNMRSELARDRSDCSLIGSALRTITASWVGGGRTCVNTATKSEHQSARMSKITKWRFNPVWHRMLYSCTHMATVGWWVKL